MIATVSSDISATIEFVAIVIGVVILVVGWWRWGKPAYDKEETRINDRGRTARHHNKSGDNND